MMRNLKSAGFVAVLVAIMIIATTRAGADGLVGKDAPDFALPTIDGSTAKLSDQKGKVVLLDFWATWCGPCILALPHVQQLASDKELADKGLVVWGVNYGETKPRANAFMLKNNYTFAVPLDADLKVAGTFGVEGIPTQIVIGKDGKVAYVGIGYEGEAGEKKLDEAIKAALAK